MSSEDSWGHDLLFEIHMKVSFVIPAYKTPRRLLARCIASIEKAFSGCSVGREMLIIHDEVVQSKARNIGLARATGDWIWFIDADDEIVANDELMQGIKRSDVDILISGIVQRWGNFGRKTLHIPPERFSGNIARECILEQHARIVFRSLCNKIFKRAFLLQNHILLDEGCEPCEDGMFIMKCIQARAKWGLVSGIVYVYWRRLGSSLFRYCPTLEEALEREDSFWDVLSNTLGVGSLSECKWDENLRRKMLLENKLLRKDGDVTLPERLYGWLLFMRRVIRFLGI